MNGFEVSQKILEADPNSRVCFISAVVVNIEALREIYPKLSFECFIKKPVTIDKLFSQKTWHRARLILARQTSTI
jgi:hypothetical protein